MSATRYERIYSCIDQVRSAVVQYRMVVRVRIFLSLESGPLFPLPALALRTVRARHPIFYYLAPSARTDLARESSRGGAHAFTKLVVARVALKLIGPRSYVCVGCSALGSEPLQIDASL